MQVQGAVSVSMRCVDDSANKLPNRLLDEFYWQGFDFLRLRLIKGFNEKEYIQNILNDSEFHIKHPMNFT